MKKLSLLFALLFVLVSFTSASAADRAGKFAFGGCLGYSFGFGDVFQEQEFGYYDPTLGFIGYKFENKVSFSFGAKVKYGLNQNLALMGALHYQGGDAEVKATAGGYSASASEGYHWTGILANVLYTLSPEKRTCPYFTGGGGLYIPEEGDSKPGINAGGGVEYFFQDNLALDAGARFHMIFTENESTTYVNIYAGVNFYLGVK
jgi:opacity protein-like surface antigen